MTCIILELFDQTPWNSTLDQIRSPAQSATHGSTPAAVGIAVAAHNSHSPSSAGPSHHNAVAMALSTVVCVQKIQSRTATTFSFLARGPFAAMKPANAYAAKPIVIPEFVGQRPALSVQDRCAKVSHAFFGRHDIIPLDE
jgi:hypothetical protein